MNPHSVRFFGIAIDDDSVPMANLPYYRRVYRKRRLTLFGWIFLFFAISVFSYLWGAPLYALVGSLIRAQAQAPPQQPQPQPQPQITPKEIIEVKDQMKKLDIAQSDVDHQISDLARRMSQVEQMATGIEVEMKTTVQSVKGSIDTRLTDIEDRLPKEQPKVDPDDPDYALKSLGACVMQVRMSELPQTSSSIWNWMFVRTVKDNMLQRKAEVVLQQAVVPGQCWSFPGETADATIKLSCPTRVLGVDLFHPPRESLIPGKEDVPDEFEVTYQPQPSNAHFS